MHLRFLLGLFVRAIKMNLQNCWMNNFTLNIELALQVTVKKKFQKFHLKMWSKRFCLKLVRSLVNCFVYGDMLLAGPNLCSLSVAYVICINKVYRYRYVCILNEENHVFILIILSHLGFKIGLSDKFSLIKCKLCTIYNKVGRPLLWPKYIFYENCHRIHVVLSCILQLEIYVKSVGLV